LTVVYVVHCVDTEGPLDETLESTFLRLRDTFGLCFDPTIENLQKLQSQQVNLSGLESAVAEFLRPDLLNTNKTWNDIDVMLSTVNAPDFRGALRDSFGNGWRVNWFCMDHVGFGVNNPRKRDTGDHKVFDYYRNSIKNAGLDGDTIEWHYHPLPVNGAVNGSGTTYLNSNNPSKILAKKIIDREWFPSSYRPGFHTERPDSHWFLEQWIPFDYGNQSTSNNKEDQPDLSNGRYGNWSKAPNDWSVYHPAHEDYQRVGHCNRWIARCLNINARTRSITQDDVDKAFLRAFRGEKTVLSFCNHDFRNMAPEIESVRVMLLKSIEKFPSVKFLFSGAAQAIQESQQLVVKKANLKVKLDWIDHSRVACLRVSSESEIFGPQPFLALRLKDKTYRWENFDFVDENVWSYTFDAQNAPPEIIDKIGVAVNSKNGVPEVHRLHVK
jgi:hypothetical protein